MGESEMGIGIYPKKNPGGLRNKNWELKIENIQIWPFRNQKEYIKYGKIYQRIRLQSVRMEIWSKVCDTKSIGVTSQLGPYQSVLNTIYYIQ